MIPQHIIDELTVKAEQYLKNRLVQMNIQVKEEHLKHVVVKVPVHEDKNWFNYYLFYGDPKQLYIFSEKLEIVFDDGVYIKQDLFDEEIPNIITQKN